MPDQTIRVTARQRADGIDIDRLALALLQFAGELPEPQQSVKAKRGKERAADSERDLSHKCKGAA